MTFEKAVELMCEALHPGYASNEVREDMARVLHGLVQFNLVKVGPGSDSIEMVPQRIMTFAEAAKIVWYTALRLPREERDYRGFIEAHSKLEDDLNRYEFYVEDFKFAVTLMWRDALKVPVDQRTVGFDSAVALLVGLGWTPLS